MKTNKVANLQSGSPVDKEENRKKRRWDIIVAVANAIGMVALGMMMEIVGPTLIHLKTRVGVNYEEVSRPLLARSIGFFLGSALGGVMCDAFPTFANLQFSTCYLVATVGTIVTPWCRTLTSLGSALFLPGVSFGFIMTGLNAAAMQMWGGKSSPALISQHLGFGIGALLAPQLANAFVWTAPLTEIKPDIITNTTDGMLNETLNVPVSNMTITEVTEKSEYAYLIIGLFCALFAIWFLAVFIMEHIYQANEVKDGTPLQQRRNLADFIKLLSPSTCTGGDTIFGSIFFIFLAFLYVHILGGAWAITKFLYSYAIESKHDFDPKSASLLNSAFWFAFTVGRAFNIAAAIIIKPYFLLPLIILMNVLTAAVLAVWASKMATILWAFSCAFGFFLSMLSPTAQLWANQYLEINALAVAVMYMGSALGGMLYQWLTGYLLEYRGPDTLMYVLLGCTLNIVLVYIIMQVMGSKHGNRFHSCEKKIERKISCTSL